MTMMDVVHHVKSKHFAVSAAYAMDGHLLLLMVLVRLSVEMDSLEDLKLVTMATPRQEMVVIVIVNLKLFLIRMQFLSKINIFSSFHNKKPTILL